jgi:hypothetical protein
MSYEHRVTGVMTDVVVDGLELVEVDEGQAEQVAVARRLGHRLLGTLGEQAAVRQSGQAVMVGERVYRRLGAPALADVPDDRDHDRAPGQREAAGMDLVRVRGAVGPLAGTLEGERSAVEQSAESRGDAGSYRGRDPSPRLDARELLGLHARGLGRSLVEVQEVALTVVHDDRVECCIECRRLDALLFGVRVVAVFEHGGEDDLVAVELARFCAHAHG